MTARPSTTAGRVRQRLFSAALATVGALTPMLLMAQGAAPPHAGGEANLVLPDIGTVELAGINSRTWLTIGLFVCALGLVFGLMISSRMKRMPVHRSPPSTRPSPWSA